MKFRIFIILPLLAFVSYAAIYSVGVSPGTITLGDVSPGETKIVKFSIFSVSDETLLVYLGSQSGDFDFFNRGYREYMPQFSEEPTSTWIEFISNPVEIDPTVSKAGRGWTDVNVLLQVPEDAEPGYHVIDIMPTPTVFGQGTAPVGTSIVAVARVSIIFNVIGDAKRSGTILDTTAYGYGGAGFHTKTFFQNTGTTTVYARTFSKVYDSNGTFLGEFASAREYVKPATTTAFDTPIEGAFPEGSYDVDSKVLFTTGDTEKTSTVRLYAPITGAAVKAQEEFPWLVVLIVLIVIIIIIAVRWFSAKR